MDTVFWVGLLLGALLGLIGSILGNLWTDSIREQLDKRRRIRISKKKHRELRRYYFAKRLREGNPTSTIYYGLLQTYFIGAVVLMTGTLGLVAILLAVAKEPALQQHAVLVKSYGIFLGIFAALLAFVVQYIYWHIYRIWSRLRRFNEYEQQIYELWGEEPEFTPTDSAAS